MPRRAEARSNGWLNVRFWPPCPASQTLESSPVRSFICKTHNHDTQESLLLSRQWRKWENVASSLALALSSGFLGLARFPSLSSIYLIVGPPETRPGKGNLANSTLFCRLPVAPSTQRSLLATLSAQGKAGRASRSGSGLCGLGESRKRNGEVKGPFFVPKALPVKCCHSI